MREDMTRALAGMAGAVILAATAHAATMAGGGYATTHAPMTIALAGGLAVGAMAIGRAWRDGRRTMGLLLLVALMAGEAWALLLTAERTLAHREAQQAPLRAEAKAWTQALANVQVAETALAEVEKAAGRETPRLAAARAAKAAADAAVLAKAAERSCAAHCRALLEAQVAAAADELAAARRDVEGAHAVERRKASEALTAARATLAGLPEPRSATPLADRLGLAGWQIDLAAAALASIAANGLGALLLAFGMHGPRSWGRRIVDVTPVEEPAPAVRRSAASEADRFARETFHPAPEAGVLLAEIRQAYRAWCAARGVEALPDREIGQALSRLFRKVGLATQGTGAVAQVIGIGWRTPLLADGQQDKAA